MDGVCGPNVVGAPSGKMISIYFSLGFFFPGGVLMILILFMLCHTFGSTLPVCAQSQGKMQKPEKSELCPPLWIFFTTGGFCHKLSLLPFLRHGLTSFHVYSSPGHQLYHLRSHPPHNLTNTHHFIGYCFPDMTAAISQPDLTPVVPEPFELPLLDSSNLSTHTPKKDVWRRILDKLAQIQKYSAYGFLGFFGLHISSTVFAPGLGINLDRCQDFFEMCRNVYLGPLFEYSAIYATAGIHVAAGIALRFLRGNNNTKRPNSQSEVIITDGERDDIGLGGVGTLLGLGFKKSWISTNFPSLTPLTFSGYIMLGALGYHFFKMKLAPCFVDGDSSLVTLHYVTHYLRQSYYGTMGRAFNYGMLVLLLGLSFYHIVSGLFKYRRQFKPRAKKIAYGVIGTCTGLSLIAMARLSRWNLETGFMGKQFALYLQVS